MYAFGLPNVAADQIVRHQCLFCGVVEEVKHVEEEVELCAPTNVSVFDTRNRAAIETTGGASPRLEQNPPAACPCASEIASTQPMVCR